MVEFNFIGQYQANFGEGRTPKKKDERDYVKMDFKGLGGVGKTKVPLLEAKKEMALSAGLGGGIGALTGIKRSWKAKLAGAALGAGLGVGVSYLGRKKIKDMDGRSDKGKKRI